ncbi:hypothetical protein [Falsirhodobacter xinxiangensis]|uniref:hypothetical protein n=1 Tax=Falsirhodobacter xinxiangensis TaxID=2530049 RepID=UPI00145BF40F|nr:hypothetical protein [Rhodobacter xinxiangensis]
MTQPADMQIETDVDRLSADLLRAIEAEPVPERIAELARQLQIALEARIAAREALETPR